MAAPCSSDTTPWISPVRSWAEAMPTGAMRRDRTTSPLSNRITTPFSLSTMAGEDTCDYLENPGYGHAPKQKSGEPKAFNLAQREHPPYHRGRGPDGRWTRASNTL